MHTQSGVMINPWSSAQYFDYEKLIKEFGIQRPDNYFDYFMFRLISESGTEEDILPPFNPVSSFWNVADGSINA